MSDEWVLEGLFHYLQKRGFPLSVRDYEDTLFALQSGFGLPHAETATRDNLLWLCKSLWARNEEEEQILHRLFKSFPFPTLAEQHRYVPPKVIDGSQISTSTATQSSKTPKQIHDALSSAPPTAEFKFNSRTAHEGSVLPSAEVQFTLDEPFVFNPPHLLSLRMLIIAWRRLRSVSRSGPKTDVDMVATIRLRCEQGFVIEPVMLPARQNRVKLIMLMDASVDMVAWYSTMNLLAESLVESHSRLAAAAVYYFDRAPRTLLYRAPTRTDAESLETVLRTLHDYQLIIVSEGGGLAMLDKEDTDLMLNEWGTFLKACQGIWSPIVWLNPLPKARWSTLTQKIAHLPHLTMLQLTSDNLIRAVDILRGLHS